MPGVKEPAPEEKPPHTWLRPEEFKRELKKLGMLATEAAKLVTVMDRFAKGVCYPNDHKRLRDGVEELRVKGQRRQIRLYFGRVDEGLVLLCLHVNFKKRQRDGHAIDLAVDRLKRFQRGDWGRERQE